MKTVVLAAGRGERLRPITSGTPKPLVKIANRPVLDYCLESLSRSGFHDILVNLHYRPEDLQDYLRDRTAPLRITARVENALSGPAGALLVFEDLLQEQDWTLVVAGDLVHDVDLAHFAADFVSSGAALSVVMKKVKRAGRFGVGVVDDANRLVSFVEKPDLPPDELAFVSCGIYCVRRELLDRIPPGEWYDFGAHLIPQLVEEGAHVRCYPFDGYWCDVGDLRSLREANLDVVRGRLGDALSGSSIAPSVWTGDDVTISPGAEIVPPVSIGARTIVEDGAVIVGPAVIGAGCVIGAGSRVEASVVMDGCRLPEGHVVVDGLLASGPRE